MGCGWADPPDTDAQRLYDAELAAPINSGKPPDDPSKLARWYRLGSIHRWLGSHPDARSQLEALEDYLRAHPEERAEDAWERVKGDVDARPPLVVEANGTPARMVVTVDRTYSSAPDRPSAVREVREALLAHHLPNPEVSDRGTRVLLLQRNGEVLMKVPLSTVPEPTGWLLVEEGKPVRWLPQDIATTTLGDMEAYFGITLQ